MGEHQQEAWLRLHLVLLSMTSARVIRVCLPHNSMVLSEFNAVWISSRELWLDRQTYVSMGRMPANG